MSDRQQQQGARYSTDFFPGDHVRSRISKLEGWVVSGRLLEFTEGRRIEIADQRLHENITAWFYPLIKNLEKIEDDKRGNQEHP